MEIATSQPAPTNTIARLSGRTLAITRMLWLTACLTATILFFVAIPYRWAQLTHPSPTNLANLNALGITPMTFAAYAIFWEIVIAAPCAIVGFIIFWRRGDERIALLTSLFLVVFGVGSGTITPTITALLGKHPALDLLQYSFAAISWITFALFFYLFPNGSFVPSWTRWLALLWTLICIVWNFLPDSPWNPLNWNSWLFAVIIGSFWASWIFSQVYRYRRVSKDIERQQTKWVVFAVTLIITVMLLSSIIGAFVPGYDLLGLEQPNPQAFAYMFWQMLFNPVMSALPIAIAFSIMRYRLWEIDLFINRALVYGALTAFVILTYIIVVGGLGVLFQSSGNILLSLIATGVIALVINPLRLRLQQFINRLMYGERNDPYKVLSQLSQHLESTRIPDSILSTTVETIAQTLKLPYAAILLADGKTLQTAAVTGSPTDHFLTLTLTHQHQAIGELRVAQRSANEPFTPAERRLLEDIAAQTGVVVHNVRLTSDLQRSREQIVAAREEERLRLRRDLHDGLGPKLAGQTLKLEAAMDALDSETETARTLLKESMTESQTLITEIRRLVYGLRPPALDQLGLLAAIREQAAQYQINGLQVTVSAPDSLPSLPAAVEVAAYRIIQEALTNVAKHAQAKNCTVSLAINKDLEIVVSDDGIGLSSTRRVGVGLSSMRERAEEIGGTCVIENIEKGGTRIQAWLPFKQ
ncbi:MAG: GAF domain-containing sensor histidine kinase [Chloroflexi bacterium]|nr:GAF domain-containing sensor histidine kinase [Chloroflexota bacterium]